MDTFLLVLRVALSLGIVVVLLWMAQKRLGRGTRAGAGVDLQVVGKRSVGPKSSVVLVETDGQRFLLGVTEHNVQVLHAAAAPERPAPEPVADPAVSGRRFSAALTGAESSGRHADDGPGPLAGSILSPATWRQAGNALRKGMLG
ncbi:flagellar biosynthetic protein FliO [Specibacter cremeus]|uniref:flagellar biosynthetic protein FliO n=1 Tax=Specibacter cremeus TaxID=1629051 RepID=UPI000F78B5EC|nr:flagellar biosynthetic protein FliO [Specibacter cremeus]